MKVYKSKLLLKLWTKNGKCSGTQNDICADELLINKRIKNIRVPTEIHRKPRLKTPERFADTKYIAVSNNHNFPSLQH